MKKYIITVILALAAIFCAYGQNASPIDIVLLLDTSSAMSSSYENVNNYITGDFLNEFLRVGDTFHLIAFSASPRLDVARRISGVGDVETIIGRMLLQYPVENGSNITASLAFAEQYLTALPARPKKIVLVSVGGPDAANAVNSSKQRLSSRNATLDFIQVTPGVPLSNTPRSGRPADARTTAATGATPAAGASAGTGTAPAANAGTSAGTRTAPAAGTGTTQPASAAPSAGATPAAGASAGTGTTPAANTGTSSTGARTTPPPASAPASGTTPPAAAPSAGTPTASATPPAGTTPSAGASASGTTPASTSPAAGGASAVTETSSGAQGQSSVSGSTAGRQSAAEQPSGTSASRDNYVPDGRDAKPSISAAERAKSKIESLSSSMPFLLFIIIIALLLLGLIIFLVSRKLGSSPNRVMAEVASSGSGAPRDNMKFVDHSKDLAKYASSQSRRSTPYEDRPLKTDNYKPPVINSSGPLLLNLFVEEQNTSIGKRNIHSLKSGYSLSVGGGKTDDYLIFLVPMPSHIGEIRRSGSSLSFIPRKPKYFPDIGSSEVKDCINKTIRVVSDKNYEMRFRFEMYEDPLISLNRMLMSVKVPG